VDRASDEELAAGLAYGATQMRYLSVCSGIEAASCAWKPLGWEAVAFSENEKYPSSVLAHHYPDVPNLGDMNDYQKWPTRLRPDVLVGGTPCQSFSIAGLRSGLADPRGNLALVYIAIAQRYRPKWVVWENVPGVLSANGGRDFGSIIGAMVELGYGVSWRVLNAQYFGVPQRRRRVFVVGCLGGWRSSAQVLFEPTSLLRDTPPSQEPQQEAAASPVASAERSGIPHVANPIIRRAGNSIVDPDWTTYLPQTVGALSDGAHCGGGLNGQDAYTGRIIPTQEHVVRRLTPLECERLQGFPDHYTDVPGSSDSGRYRALGNTMAVPVMNWIGKRISP
jgi:DNA (cytosine-5)-methyltransferase 1